MNEFYKAMCILKGKYEDFFFFMAEETPNYAKVEKKGPVQIDE